MATRSKRKRFVDDDNNDNNRSTTTNPTTVAKDETCEPPPPQSEDRMQLTEAMRLNRAQIDNLTSALEAAKQVEHTLSRAMLEIVAGPMALRVRLSIVRLTGKATTVMIHLEATVYDLKLLIQAHEGIPPEQQRLNFGGGQLSDTKSLREYNIQRDSKVHMVLHLRGC